MVTKFEIFRDINDEWRWHATRKGRIVAEAGEGYKRVSGCKTSLLSFMSSIKQDSVVIIEPETKE